MSYQTDVIVVGAGIVGLACARKLALLGLEVIVLEAGHEYGSGISARNSEVIHAGLYYPPGSLKARLCRLGREQLYAYCEQRALPFKQVGKWVVASEPEQIATLEQIARTAQYNGCTETYLMDKQEAARLEPALRAESVLVSPRTGIVDSHAVMTSFLGDIQDAGSTVVFNTPVVSGSACPDGLKIDTGGSSPATISARYVVNAAGLDAVAVAASFEGMPAQHLPQMSYAKGSYFALAGKSPFTRLIYPVPEPGGLGIHLTLDLQGQARFGPDVEWVSAPDYHVADTKAAVFCQAIQRYWPDCTVDRLRPAYAGIRPKLGTREQFLADFYIQSKQAHGLDGLVNLLGIESPGLTSCLAIADEVARQLELTE